MASPRDEGVQFEDLPGKKGDLISIGGTTAVIIRRAQAHCVHHVFGAFNVCFDVLVGSQLAVIEFYTIANDKLDVTLAWLLHGIPRSKGALPNRDMDQLDCGRYRVLSRFSDLEQLDD